MSVNKFSFNIFNEKYQIVSDRPLDTVEEAVSRVDSLMVDIASKLETKDRAKVAVLAALKLAEELVCLEQQLDSGDKEVLGLVDKIRDQLQL